MTNKTAYLPKPESGMKCPKTSTPRNNPFVRTTTSESLEIHTEIQSLKLSNQFALFNVEITVQNVRNS